MLRLCSLTTNLCWYLEPTDCYCNAVKWYIPENHENQLCAAVHNNFFIFLLTSWEPRASEERDFSSTIHNLKWSQSSCIVGDVTAKDKKVVYKIPWGSFELSSGWDLNESVHIESQYTEPFRAQANHSEGKYKMVMSARFRAESKSQ